MITVFTLTILYYFDVYMIEKQFEYKTMTECKKRQLILEREMKKEGYPLHFSKCSKNSKKKKPELKI